MKISLLIFRKYILRSPSFYYDINSLYHENQTPTYTYRDSTYFNLKIKIFLWLCRGTCSLNSKILPILPFRDLIDQMNDHNEWIYPEGNN